MKATGPQPAPAFDPELRRLLAQNVKGLAIDEKQIRAHVIRPQNIEGVFSDRGPSESKVLFAPVAPIVGVVPHRLDVTTFAAALDNALVGKVAGYSVQLRQHGQAIFSKERQWAKAPQDGSESWTPDVQLHVASVSKLITAMAMTQLMIERGISPDAQIIDYLPDYWAKGPNIQYIVFRNLMNHTSGLTAPDIFDFQIMEKAIADGISLDPNAPNHLGNYAYHNLNFGLCRILLAVMNGTINKSANFTPLFNDQFWDWVTIATYTQYAQGNVFAPAGVSGATLDHAGAAGLAYKGPGDAAKGWNSGSLESVSGAAGWHLSVDQVLNVMGAFRRGGSIVAPAAAQGMLDNGFGVDPFVSTLPPGVRVPPGLLTPAGEIYCKNGRWFDGNGHEEQSLAYFLPGDMELVVLANSPVIVPGSPEQFFRDLVTQVYLNNLTTQMPNA
jgi:CubicO group peptidase (beta-lactamase class C family)